MGYNRSIYEYVPKDLVLHVPVFSVVLGETALLHGTRGLKWPKPTSS
jgi:hypothetical protein